MKSLFGFLALVTVLLLAATIAAPELLRPLVVSAVQQASPFGRDPLDVEVDLSALDLLQGRVGRIHVTGTDLARDIGDNSEPARVTIARADVTASQVAIGDHAIAALDGTLDGILIDLGGVTSLRIDSITLSGPSTTVTAVAHFDAEQAVTFVLHALDEQGVTVGNVQLADGGISFVVFEQRVTVPLGVQDGALVVTDFLGGGPLQLLAPLPGDAWRLTGASITTAGIDLDATVDAGRLLGWS